MCIFHPLIFFRIGSFVVIIITFTVHRTVSLVSEVALSRQGSITVPDLGICLGIIAIILAQPEERALNVARRLQRLASSSLLDSHADEHGKIHVLHFMLGRFLAPRRSTLPPSRDLVQSCHLFHHLFGPVAIVKLEGPVDAIVGKTQQSDRNQGARGLFALKGSIAEAIAAAEPQHAREGRNQVQIHEVGPVGAPPRNALAPPLPRGTALLVPVLKDEVPGGVRVAVAPSQRRDGDGRVDDVRPAERLDRFGAAGGPEPAAQEAGPSQPFLGGIVGGGRVRGIATPS
mmetsp:Transcript_10104/g.21848  ORF Transcript_10104/g.21848 Transcript_10104/m.21848 type:complete len:287 (-) Transcript_10104:11-871(-)